MARRVKEVDHKISVLTDIQFMDFTELDAYFQTIYCPEATLADWRRYLRERKVVIKCKVVLLLVGNSQISLSPELSVAAQMKKLICAIWEVCEGVKKVVVGTLLPRPDKELETEQELKDFNNGLQKAVREGRKYLTPGGKNTGVMPLCHLFLERYEYFVFGAGCTVYMIRVRKPVSRYFVNGGPKLNKIGMYHLCSYILQELGFLSGVNTWDGIPLQREPPEIQQDKRLAWLKS